jgi:hypothetical protein
MWHGFIINEQEPQAKCASDYAQAIAAMLVSL